MRYMYSCGILMGLESSCGKLLVKGQQKMYISWTGS